MAASIQLQAHFQLHLVVSVAVFAYLAVFSVIAVVVDCGSWSWYLVVVGQSSFGSFSLRLLNKFRPSGQS